MRHASAESDEAQNPLAMNKKARVVLEAATRVFLQHGFNAATTDMIQCEAGVSKSTVYAHYANKEALFKAVIAHECAMFVNRIRAIEFRPGGLRETLTETAQAYLQRLLSPAGLALFRVAVAEAPRFPQLGHVFYRSGPREMTQMVARHLEQAAKTGEVDLASVGIEVAASVFVNLVRGELHMQCLTHPEARPSAVQIDRWADAAVLTFLRAYGTGPVCTMP